MLIQMLVMLVMYYYSQISTIKKVGPNDRELGFKLYKLLTASD